ncbi:MAG: hypothetical protein DMG68_07910 [Acidobacteria bacterium]|nr:MAG: hypothetical protein DMG68_07910 [Acidobacteriota bacterium]
MTNLLGVDAPSYCTVNDPVFVLPFRVAETCTIVCVETGLVPTTTEPLVNPAVTVTEEGIDAIAPPPLTTVIGIVVSTAGATFSVTLKFELLPPVTLEGLNAALLGTGGVTVRFADTL